MVQYDQALARLPARLSSIQSQTHLSIETFNPNADLRSLIEGHRTGPFKPQAHVYESLEVDQPDVSFGIDLKRWAGETGWKAATSAPKREKGAVPGVLEGLLSGISALDEGLPDEGMSNHFAEQSRPLHSSQRQITSGLGRTHQSDATSSRR